MDGGAWWAAVHGLTTEQLHFHFSLSCIGEGNGSPIPGIPQLRRLEWVAISFSNAGK